MFESVESYYQFHSKIYDLTRWAILFGRNEVTDMLPHDYHPDKILDLGCGTGKHLPLLINKFPNSKIIGVDASEYMISKIDPKIASNPNVELINSDWNNFLKFKRDFDVILCSYSLTIAAEPEQNIIRLKHSLSEDGFILVVDFKSTPIKTFKHWMRFNHVDISGLVYKTLTSQFLTHSSKTKSTWFGLWKYFLFCGQK